MIFNSGVVIFIGRVVIHMVGGLLAVLWLVTASDSTVASCGDYLVKQAHPAAGAHVAAGAHFPDDEKSDSVLLPEIPLSFPLCSGPGCRQAPQSPSQPHLADFQRVTFRDLEVPGMPGVTADGSTAYLEHASKVLPKSPDRDRLKRPPDLS